MSETVPPALLAWLRDAFDDPTLEVGRYEKLAGGAIQQNMALDLVREGGARSEALVLRTDAPSGVSVSRSRAEEHALLSAAFDAGVTVPEPLAMCTDPAVLERPFFLMRRVAGTTHPVRLTRGDALDDTERDPLVAALGAELARIHAVPLDDARLGFLHDGETDDDRAAPTDAEPTDALASHVARYRRLLAELGARRPVLDWALDWLDRQAPAPRSPVLCHNDFRTGNLMIGAAGGDERGGAGATGGRHVAGVLDWEFAAIGDPHADIGWFCAPCWRFASREREAGGLGSREAFYAGYERASGRTIDREAVPIWEIVATVRWAVIALQQGARFTSGAEPTLELGLTGRMIAELEQDVLELVGAASRTEATTGAPATTGTKTGTGTRAEGEGEANVTVGTGTAFGAGAPGDTFRRDAPPDDEPSGGALLAAARGALLERLLPALPGDLRYECLMIANAMGIAERELTAMPGNADGAGGAGGDMRGDVPDDMPDDMPGDMPGERSGSEAGALDGTVPRALRDDVRRRLALANPKRLRSP